MKKLRDENAAMRKKMEEMMAQLGAKKRQKSETEKGQPLVAGPRANAMLAAKEMGLALHLYAQDHEDKFPAAGPNFKSAIAGHVENPEALKTFVYTYGGGSILSIPDVTRAELGYVAGPEGKAVLYADGHVQWR